MKITVLLSLFLLLLITACTPTTSVPCSPSIPPTPTPIPTLVSYNGIWEGTTGEGETITISVQDSMIVEVEYTIHVVASEWSASHEERRVMAATIYGTRSRWTVFDGSRGSLPAFDFQATIEGDTMSGVLAQLIVHPQGMGIGLGVTTFDATLIIPAAPGAGA